MPRPSLWITRTVSLKDRQLPYTINTEIRMLYNPQLKGAYSFVPGVMAMVLMLVCTMMTAITIVREKEMGTMEDYAGVTDAAIKNHSGKSGPLLVVIAGKYRQHFVAECICAGCADQWKFAVIDSGKYTVYSYLSCIWIA